MVREIITIDEEKCTGCGLCIPNCPEGALQVIDGKARLVSDLFCDGLGACIGHCPEGAITVETREAGGYDERRVMENIVQQGEATIAAHLKHLEEHGERELLSTAKAFLAEKGIRVPPAAAQPEAPRFACPGSLFKEIQREGATDPAAGPAGVVETSSAAPSELAQWPVQFHLLPTAAPWLRNQELLLCADCVAYAVGDFHRRYLRGKALAIACPKLDSRQDVYLQKLRALIDDAGIKSVEVLMMQVPCCRGLLRLVREAAAEAERKIPVRYSVISVEGEVLETGDMR